MAGNENPSLAQHSSLGIGVQASKGTAVAPTIWFDFSEEENRTDVELHEPTGVATWVGGVPSRQRQAASAVVVKKDGRIGFKCEPRFDHLLYLLPLAFGAAMGGSEYVPGSQDDWITVEVDKVAANGSGHSVERYADGKITTLTIESDQNGVVTVTVAGVAGAKTVVTGTTPDWSAWLDKPPFIHSGLSFLVAGMPTWLPPNMAYSLKVEFNSGVEEDHFANNLTRIVAPPGEFTATGTLEIPWNDETQGVRDVMEDGERFDLHLQYAGYGDETFGLELSCKLKGDPVKVSGKDGLKAQLSFECYQSGSTNAVKAVFGS